MPKDKTKNYHHFWDIEQIKSLYIDLITRITDIMSDHFHNLQQSPAFEYLVTSTSAKDLKKIQRKLYSNLFSISSHCWRKNSVVKNVLLELSVFRRYLLLIIGNNKSKQYKDLWKKIVTSSVIKKNILLVLEFLLITPLTNVTIEREFSMIEHVKTDF